MDSNHPKNRFELPTTRLATSDAEGHRIYLYPAEVEGRYARRRAWFHPALLAIFLVLPWLSIDGEPVLLLDVAHQRFTVLGSTFWAHDAPFLFFLFAGFALSVAFVTAVWGRVWCGWACPQTVFIESVFRRLERWIEGESHSRKRADEAPPTWRWRGRKALKWAAFLAVTLVLSHTFVAYFVGADHLLSMMHQSPADAPGWFLFMAIVTGTLLFDFGWFREQFCVIACPYGRIQSVFLDENSKVILYDERRGEPRHGAVAAGERPGDCVNCYRCVQVCPTGVDIRRGTQLECIACTACIDACDEVMRKVKKPEGLIRIAAPAELMAGGNGRPVPWLRPNTVVYLALLTTVLSVLGWAASQHHRFGAEFLRAGEAPYQVISDERGRKMIINHFHADFSNESRQTFQFQLKLASPGDITLVAPQDIVAVESGQKQRVDFFIEIPEEEWRRNASSNVPIAWTVSAVLELPASTRSQPLHQEIATLHFVGPLASRRSEP